MSLLLFLCGGTAISVAMAIIKLKKNGEGKQLTNVASGDGEGRQNLGVSPGRLKIMASFRHRSSSIVEYGKITRYPRFSSNSL